MAPSPINLTPTYFVDYTGLFGERSFQVRTAPTTTDAAALSSIAGFLTILLPDFHNDVSFIGVRKRAVGATVSLPVSGWTVMTGTGATGTPEIDYPKYVNFVGRARAGVGRRVRLSLYGMIVPIEGDYRLELADLGGAINDAVDYLNTQSTAGIFRTIDGNPANWYLYANEGFNAYYQRKARVS